MQCLLFACIDNLEFRLLNEARSYKKPTDRQHLVFEKELTLCKIGFHLHSCIHWEQVCVCTQFHCEYVSTSLYLCQVQSINFWCVWPPELFHYNRESSEAQGLPEERLAHAISNKSTNSIKSQVTDTWLEKREEKQK